MVPHVEDGYSTYHHTQTYQSALYQPLQHKHPSSLQMPKLSSATAYLKLVLGSLPLSWLVQPSSKDGSPNGRSQIEYTELYDLI